MLPPDEATFARWVGLRMEESKAFDTVELVECEPGRPNVHGTAGGGSGRSLLLAGHLDTVAVEDWVQHWHGTDREDPFGAHVVDGEIWGRGVADQKAGICAIIEAVRAFGRVGLRPAGRVSTLFVCDEESGQPGSGVSAGMRAAVDGRAGPRPAADFAIYTEPTTSAIYTAQMGFLIADVAYTGVSAYFGRPELGVDALRAGHRLLEQLWGPLRPLAGLGPRPRPAGRGLPAGYLRLLGRQHRGAGPFRVVANSQGASRREPRRGG